MGGHIEFSAYRSVLSATESASHRIEGAEKVSYEMTRGTLVRWPLRNSNTRLLSRRHALSGRMIRDWDPDAGVWRRIVERRELLSELILHFEFTLKVHSILLIAYCLTSLSIPSQQSLNAAAGCARGMRNGSSYRLV